MSEDDDENLNLTDVVDRLEPDDEQEKTTVGKILGHFDGQALGPLLLVPGLLAVSPVGMIPGMSLAMGTVIVLVSIQMIIGRKRPWLPDRVEEIDVPADKLQKSADKSRPVARWIDQHLHARWSFLVEHPGTYVLASLCLLLGVSMWPLALVPFGVAAPGTAVSLFGLALTLRNGLIALLGYIACAAVLVLGAWLWMGS